MVTILLIASLITLAALSFGLDRVNTWRVERQARLAEQRRIQHEQFIAERRLQALSQEALQRLLDEARQAPSSGDVPDGQWYRP